MKALTRIALVAVALLLTVTRADAQGTCGNCDPYGPCGVSCYYCTGTLHPDYCEEIEYTTCEEAVGGCNRNGCTPNWVTTDRVTVGKYGETTYGVSCSPLCQPTFGCDHHNVDRVTQHDNNECNVSAAYNNRTFCHDYVNASKPHQTGSIPDCCSIFEGPQFTCNDWHSCF